jgi:hypothetical protein
MCKQVIQRENISSSQIHTAMIDQRDSTTREKFHNHVYERAQSGIKEQLCHDISSDTCGKMSMAMARVSRPQNKRSGNRKED